MREDWLLIADRNFYNWQDWCTAADTGAALLWRVKSDLILEPLEFFMDGSYRSVLVNPKVTGKARDKIRDAARAGEDLDPQKARYVRVVEYEVPDRAGDGKDELIALITTITEFTGAPAGILARAYHERWEHEIGHRWHRSSCAAFSWLCSLFLVRFVFLLWRCPAGAVVVAGRACPALA